LRIASFKIRIPKLHFQILNHCRGLDWLPFNKGPKGCGEYIKPVHEKES